MLASDVDVTAVITNPDRPAGRRMALTPPPVKSEAEAAGVLVLQPPKARDPELLDRLRQLAPDVAIVVAYGSLLPAELLAVPPLGFVNLHFSLLPAYRGAAPVQRALMDGCRVSGVSIMILTAGMDEGPVLARREVTVEDEDTAGTLGRRMAEIGAGLLVDTIHGYAAGRIVPEEQDHEAATYAPKITDEEARVDWSLPADRIVNLVRALNPDPGAWSTFRETRLKLWFAGPVQDTNLEPGELDASRTLVVGAGEGAIEIVEAQLAGKRRMSGAELARGLRVRAGERLE